MVALVAISVAKGKVWLMIQRSHGKRLSHLLSLIGTLSEKMCRNEGDNFTRTAKRVAHTVKA